MRNETDVLIVGAGPVGLTMAIELVRYGVRVRIIDKTAQRTDKSKALVLWSRSLELLERSGCSAALVEAGFRVDGVRISAGKQSIAHITLDGIDSAYPYALMLPQSETERILEEFLNGLGVQVERETELLNFHDRGGSVVSALQHSAGAPENVESSWLIGCDGAHSTVRHQLGMAFQGVTSLINWGLADVYLTGMLSPPEIQVIWHPEGTLTIFPITENRYRIIAEMGVVQETDTHPVIPTLADIQAILNQRFPGDIQASDAVWLSAFHVNERKVADYRAGRVFLAGDAAHVHSPAGGQGMNTGIQDACNLAWKLALVVQGHSSDSLLDSYNQERSPVAEAVLKATGRVTALTTTENHFIQSVRNYAAALVLELPLLRRFAANTMSETLVHYPGSALNGSGIHLGPAPGERAPISTDGSLVGAGATPRFVLFADAACLPAGLLERYADIVEQTVQPPYHPNGMWLVRPDGYMALSARQGDCGALVVYLDRIFRR